MMQELVPPKIVDIHNFPDEESATRNPFLVIFRMLRLVKRLRGEHGLVKLVETTMMVVNGIAQPHCCQWPHSCTHWGTCKF